MALTTEQKQLLWDNSQFKKDLRYCANIIALFIQSEPNYGLDYIVPSSEIQLRVISFWQKRNNLAFSFIRKPEDSDLFRMLMYAASDGNFEAPSPITFNVNDPVYVLWDISNEVNGLAGYIKKIWNDLAGVRSNEYPWAGENGNIQEPAGPNWYADHFAQLPNRF